MINGGTALPQKPSTSSPFDVFVDDLVEKGDDWDQRSIFADWAADNGRIPLSECLRWMVENKKRPYRGKETNKGVWFNEGAISEGLGDSESDIPSAIYKHLPVGEEVTGDEVANHKGYKQARFAETSFFIAWEAAIAEGWEP
jgi:hypothetical protein